MKHPVPNRRRAQNL